MSGSPTADHLDQLSCAQLRYIKAVNCVSNQLASNQQSAENKHATFNYRQITPINSSLSARNRRSFGFCRQKTGRRPNVEAAVTPIVKLQQGTRISQIKTR